MSVTFFIYFGKLLLLSLLIFSSSVWLFFFIVTISQLKLYATKFKFCALKKLPVNICVLFTIKRGSVHGQLYLKIALVVFFSSLTLI